MAICLSNWDAYVSGFQYVPRIAYAVHWCAWFTHYAKKSHEDAVKNNCQYLHGTKHHGLIFQPTGHFTVDCYVVADFAGLWTFEDDQDPVCMKSCTGYVLTFSGCPLLWTSTPNQNCIVHYGGWIHCPVPGNKRCYSYKNAYYWSFVEFWCFSWECFTHSTIFEDNNGALTLANVPKMTPQLKHILVPCK